MALHRTIYPSYIYELCMSELLKIRLISSYFMSLKLKLMMQNQIKVRTNELNPLLIAVTKQIKDRQMKNKDLPTKMCLFHTDFQTEIRLELFCNLTHSAATQCRLPSTAASHFLSWKQITACTCVLVSNKTAAL